MSSLSNRIEKLEMKMPVGIDTHIWCHPNQTFDEAADAYKRANPNAFYNIMYIYKWRDEAKVDVIN